MERDFTSIISAFIDGLIAEEVKDFLAPLDIPRDFESLVEIASRIDNRLLPESPSPPAGAEEPMQLGRTKLASGRATEEAQGGRLLLLREIRTPVQPLPSKRGGSSGLRRVLAKVFTKLDLRNAYHLVRIPNHISMDPAKVNTVTNWPPLTSKKKWNDKAEEAFNKLKQKFTTAPYSHGTRPSPSVCGGSGRF
ncbi:hypothetical protein L3Q82_013714 [Scortum barcoo]|uniref:Uncharacterized protein n=1 Tax=Scortum barcoo TaxID=214431 RepID=A0ACB8W1H8_9TELE|nr:hypothetical protein L3Q82_013714 [Scortum barcoo]